MKNKALAILLCLGLCIGLTACGGEDKGKEKPAVESAASVNNGDLKEDSTALAIGKTKVPYNEYQAYYYFMKNQYENVLNADIWKYTGAGEKGKSIGQEAIEDVLRLIIQVKVIGKAAAEKGVVLEVDEKEVSDYNAKKYFDSINEKVRKENGITLAVMTQIFAENKLAAKMYNVVMGTVDVNVTAEQSKAARVQLIYLKADDKTKAQVKQKADALCAQAKNSVGSFYSLARKNTQAAEVECLIGRLDERTNLVNAVMGLKQYAVSGVIEEKDGYYIAYCVEPGNKKIFGEYKNQVVESRQVSAFQKAYKEWSGKYEVKVSKSLLAK